MTALAHFRAKLDFETDVSDVHAALEAGPNFVLVDSRGDEAWAQGRIPGALHLPTREITHRGTALIPHGTPIVTYCWGPACNGATRAALEFAQLGYPVREMIGGFEYWAREGFAVETDEAVRPERPDPLTTVVAAVRCDC
jgi:rhodanese-related sulfurtransferase